MISNKKLINAYFSILIPTYLTLCSCTSYHVAPLKERKEHSYINSLVIQANKSPLLKQGAVSLDDGLNLDELANLALYNSPLLKVNRQQYKVSQANAINLGLISDPLFSASFDRPNGNVLNVVNAWSGGIGYDLNTLISHQSMLDIGNEQIIQAKLVLLWQAWQIKQQAKLLCVDIYYSTQKIKLVKSMIVTLEQRYQQSKVGVLEGNITIETNGTDLSVLLDAYSKLSFLQQEHNTSTHQLTQLLGINSLVGLSISPLSAPYEISKEFLNDTLPNIARYRPDLLALQAGYQAQEATVRATILAQFPSLNFGISTVRDTGGLHTNGINIGITLPLFNGNKGNILVSRATRKQLAEEYYLRLTQTRKEVEELWQLNEIITEHQTLLAERLPSLQKVVTSARKAYGNGDIAALSFINMEATLFNKQLEQFDLQQNKWRTQLGLSSLLMFDATASTSKVDENQLIYLD